MKQFSEEILISAPAETIFAVYRNVGDWQHWDPDVASASLSGNFEPGSTGELKPTHGPAADIELSAVEDNRAFTVTAKLPLCIMSLEHELHPAHNKTRAVHRVSFTGPLASFYSRVVGQQIYKGLPGSLQGLKAISEQKAV